jgi:hypothetical protein
MTRTQPGPPKGQPDATPEITGHLAAAQEKFFASWIGVPENV